MLWGLEALRVFDDRLSGSLSQIQKAQDAMERIVKQVCNLFQCYVICTSELILLPGS